MNKKEKQKEMTMNSNINNNRFNRKSNKPEKNLQIKINKHKMMKNEFIKHIYNSILYR